jgi:hypothetical protein
MDRGIQPYRDGESLAAELQIAELQMEQAGASA